MNSGIRTLSAVAGQCVLEVAKFRMRLVTLCASRDRVAHPDSNRGIRVAHRPEGRGRGENDCVLVVRLLAWIILPGHHVIISCSYPRLCRRIVDDIHGTLVERDSAL